MISDTLSEAVDEIRYYLSDEAFASSYPPGPLRDRIEAVVTEMEAIRQVLDTPPDSFSTPDAHLGGLLVSDLAKSDIPPDPEINAPFYAAILKRMSHSPVYAKVDLLAGCFVRPGAKPLYYVDNLTGERIKP